MQLHLPQIARMTQTERHEAVRLFTVIESRKRGGPTEKASSPSALPPVCVICEIGGYQNRMETPQGASSPRIRTPRSGIDSDQGSVTVTLLKRKP